MKVGPKLQILGMTSVRKNLHSSEILNTNFLPALMLPLVKISSKSDNIWESKDPKTSLKGPFYGCGIHIKNFKIFNLTTTNAILMKLTTIMYLDKTFNLAENCDVNHRS